MAKKDKGNKGQGKLNKLIEQFNQTTVNSQKQAVWDKIQKVANKNDLLMPDDIAAWKNPEATPIKAPTFDENLGDTQKLIDAGLATGEKLAEKYPVTVQEVSETIDPKLAEHLARLEAGLGGYTAAENQALVEQAQQGIDQSYQTQMRQLAGANAMYGRTGGAALTPLQQLAAGRVMGQQALQSDILTKNIEEKNRRNEYFTGALERKQAVEKGAEAYNAQARSAAEAARMGTIFGGASLMTGTYGGVAGQNLEQQALEWAQKKAEEDRKAQMGYLDSYLGLLGKQGASLNQAAQGLQIGAGA